MLATTYFKPSHWTLVLMLLTAPFVGVAQTKPSFILKLGPVISFSNQKDETLDTRFGQSIYTAGSLLRLHLTGAANLQLTEKMSFQPEAGFWGGGYREVWKESGGGDRSTEIYKIRITYFRASALGKLCVKDLDDMRFFALAGPYAQLALFGKAITTYREGGQSETEKETVTFGNGKNDFMSRFDWGFSLGGGVEKPFPFGTVTADLRYSLGLRDLAESGDGLFSESAFRFNSIQVSLGFKLPKR